MSILGFNLSEVTDSIGDHVGDKLKDARSAISGAANKTGETFTQNLVAYFRGTKTGQSLETEATRQKIVEIFSDPVKLLMGAGAAVLLVLGARALFRG